MFTRLTVGINKLLTEKGRRRRKHGPSTFQNHKKINVKTCKVCKVLLGVVGHVQKEEKHMCKLEHTY